MNTAGPAAAKRRYAFVFVCQAGDIEIKALLLAASLRRCLGSTCELIAAVPGPADFWGELSALTREQLHEFGVTLAPISNPLDPGYGIGNKLACVDVPAQADKIIFLDSDILCLRDFGDPDCLHVPFAAKPADVRTFAAAAEAWRPLYAAAGAPLPTLSLPTTVTGEFGLPYFNSGMIVVDNGLHFGRAWIDCALAIRDTPTMREQRHWLDQVSLPIALYSLGLTYSALDERFNFPAHLKPLPAEPPFLCHYHWPRIVRREPVLLGLVRELAQAHPNIARVAARDPDWAQLLRPDAPMPPAAADSRIPFAAPEQIVVTGLPGSGAPELTAALARHGCVAAYDPAELASALAAQGLPWELATFARIARARPRETGDDAATVAIGSELPLLYRLDAVGRVLPRARLVACVRNPFDTIAAWKALPAEQLDAAMAAASATAGKWLSAAAGAQLERIAAIGDAAEKRAAWWWWLAQRLLDRIRDLTVVRYEDLIAAPAAAVRVVLDGAETGSGPVIPRSDAALDANDRQAIRAICLQAAAELGVAGC